MALTLDKTMKKDNNLHECTYLTNPTIVITSIPSSMPAYKDNNYYY